MKANHNDDNEDNKTPLTISNISKILNESKSQHKNDFACKGCDYFQYFKDTK